VQSDSWRKHGGAKKNKCSAGLERSECRTFGRFCKMVRRFCHLGQTVHL